MKNIDILRMIFGFFFVVLGIQILIFVWGADFNPSTGFSTQAFEKLGITATVDFLLGVTEIILFLIPKKNNELTIKPLAEMSGDFFIIVF